MTIEEMATIMSGELTWISMLLIIVLLVNIASWIYMSCKLRKQNCIIDELEYQLRHSKKSRKATYRSYYK